MQKPNLATNPMNRATNKALRMTSVSLLGIFALLLLLGACSGGRPAVRPGRQSSIMTASWYGPKYHGRRTANGEVYDMNGLSAAHKTLPFGTVLKVTHLGNGRSVVVAINDRGPFIKGRDLDLSYGAAKKLRMVDEGVTKVKIERVN